MSFSNNELFQKGLPDCRQMVSNLNVDRSLENGSSEFGFPNQQLVTELAIPIHTLNQFVNITFSIDGVGATYGHGQAMNASSEAC